MDVSVLKQDMSKRDSLIGKGGGGKEGRVGSCIKILPDAILYTGSNND